MSKEQEDYQTPRAPNIINGASNTFSFGFGLVQFILGIVYLSVYRYRYSLTTFSIDLMAGFMLTSGIIILALTTVRIFLKKPNEQLILVLTLAGFLILFFVLYLILGSVGLGMNNNGQFKRESRNNILMTARMYDENQKGKIATLKMDWLHNRYNCCGIDSLNDWKALYDYRNPYQPISYYDKQAYQHNRPYTSDVPDSCCKNRRSQCGKQGNFYGRDRSEFLFEQGCLGPYMSSFERDVRFLCGLSIAASIIYLISGVGLLYVFNALRKSFAFEDIRNNNRLLYH